MLIRAAATDLLAGRSVRSLAREWNDATASPPGAADRGAAVGFRHDDRNPRYAALMTHKGKVVGKGDGKPILDEDTHLAVTALLTDPARRSQHSLRAGVHGQRRLRVR